MLPTALAEQANIDAQVAEAAVNEPRRGRAAGAVEVRGGQLELVERIVAGLIDPRVLARRADEHAAEQERQRRMVVPEGDEALELAAEGGGRKTICSAFFGLM